MKNAEEIKEKDANKDAKIRMKKKSKL